MAIVQIDLSEYDTVRNRIKELEKKVEELEDANKNLKNTSKVLVRNEHFVYDNDSGKQRKVVSESYIGFEDVRLKVEAKFEKDVQKQKQQYEESKQYYNKKYAEVEKTVKQQYEAKLGNLRKSLEDRNTVLQNKSDEYKKLNNKINEIAKDARQTLCGNYFYSSKVKRMLEEIIHQTNSFKIGTDNNNNNNKDDIHQSFIATDHRSQEEISYSYV